jgi:transcriptional regulator with GAF, ATPase, and Fis domain
MELIATNGPLAGTALTLADGVTITDPSAKSAADRPCCRFQAVNSGSFVLHVLHRQTPVFVNGLPVTTRVLEPHDELRIGESLFVARHEELVAPPGLASCPVQTAAGSPAAAVAELSFDDALLQNKRTAVSRDARDLGALLRVGAALSAVHGLATLDAAVAGLILDVVPGERVVLTSSDASGKHPAQSAWSATASTAVPVRVDAALLERASKARAAVTAEIGDRHVVVVPMMAFGRVTGTIWTETSRARRLDDGHVRLLLAVAALAGMARAQAQETARLQQTNEVLQAQINLDHDMIGGSKPMQLLFERIARVAKTDSTILIRGESGTGKELVARAVHRNSGRADRPFVAINCAAITETLLESELFGHEKGAFTGAIGLKKGKLELADTGTLFLDEIGELPLPLQAKLLRAIQEREFERVGGTRPVRVDFRLIAATNRDLESAVKAVTFRQDLFYRLNVVTLSLPALRDRKDDLLMLAEHFVRKHAARCDRPVQGVASNALERLSRHDWPGNVRELENVIEQALALGSDDRIVAEDLPPGLGEGPLSAAAESAVAGQGSFDYHVTIEQTKRDLIVRAIEASDHSYTAAARLLGVHPNYLHRLIRNLNLKPQLGKQRN